MERRGRTSPLPSLVSGYGGMTWEGASSKTSVFLLDLSSLIHMYRPFSNPSPPPVPTRRMDRIRPTREGFPSLHVSNAYSVSESLDPDSRLDQELSHRPTRLRAERFREGKENYYRVLIPQYCQELPRRSPSINDHRHIPRKPLQGQRMGCYFDELSWGLGYPGDSPH